MHWMCVLYEDDPMTAAPGCAGPGWVRRGYLPAEPCTEAAAGPVWPHRNCRAGTAGATGCRDGALRTGVAA